MFVTHFVSGQGTPIQSRRRPSRAGGAWFEQHPHGPLRRRVKDHLLRFIALHDQLTVTKVDEKWLREIESRDNLFPDVNWTYWK